MMRIIRLLAKLYPREWRSRYGEEFEALLEDMAAGGWIAFDVVGGALLMQVRRWHKAGAVALLTAMTLAGASWWVARRPYITSGSNQIFRMDSTAGGLLEFLVIVILSFLALLTMSGVAWGVRACAAIAGSYVGAVVLISLLTPQKIVAVGDSYCWDLWCAGIQRVTTTQSGPDKLYTAQLRIFADSRNAHSFSAEQAKRFVYIIDDKGRRYSMLPEFSLVGADATVQPGKSLTSSIVFRASASPGRFYLTADIPAPFWVRLYLGSDLNPFHRRTLLRLT